MRNRSRSHSTRHDPQPCYLVTMAATWANADGQRDAFRKQIRIAAGRYHLERLARASWPIAWTLAAALWFVLIVALFTSLASRAGEIGLALVVTGLVCAIVVYRSRLERRRLLVRMDMHGQLPDSVLTAADWENASGDPWRERQRVETLRRLEKIDWRRAWPVRWPRLLWLPLAGAMALLLALGLVQRGWTQQERIAHLAETQANAPLAAEKLKPLEQVFKDWEAAQKIAPTPELEKMLQQLKPMREQMAAGEMTEKQVLLKLNEMQAELQAQRDKLQAGSLDAQAQTMADAVKDLDGMSGLAAALQRKDFAAAKEQAAEAQKKYESGAAKTPEGQNAENAASKLSDAAQKTSNDAQTSSSLSQMSKAASGKSGPQQSGSKMAKGLEGLKNGMAQQAQRQAQSHALGTQMAQLGEAKNEMAGNGEGQGQDGKMPGSSGLSLARTLQQQKGGKGAGSDSDPNRFGEQTQLDSANQQMKLTGTAGDGASQKQTERTNSPHMETTASGIDAAQFSAYEKMSEQATQDENLPVADRQMIKRYFENIRPQTHP